MTRQPEDEVRSALDYLARATDALIRGCPAPELRIVREVVAGLRTGLDVYGVMPDDEARDMRREALEEVRDALIYVSRLLLDEEGR